MAVISHLRSLQALDLAVREGSLKGAADKLGITPAAVGQRIRALEDYLGTDLLLRGRSGLSPTKELHRALPDLRAAFEALERVTETLDFQRITEIHMVADPDWSELWLMPRLPEFRRQNPNILFCINGAGDVPLRLGSPDIRVTYGGHEGEELLTDLFLPITGPDNSRRIADWDPVHQMEGLPLLHLKRQLDEKDMPGWPDWFDQYGHRASGPDRGIKYQHARLALEAVRENVGFLLCGLALALDDLKSGAVVLPFSERHVLRATSPYRLTVRGEARARPQTQRFADWLRAQSRETQAEIDTFHATHLLAGH